MTYQKTPINTLGSKLGDICKKLEDP